MPLINAHVGKTGKNMAYFSEETSEAAVLSRLADNVDPRFREIMESAIKHLHAFVKEVEPSLDEWLRAIRFLTATGQICDDRRQEWILASDTLGLSMLVDAINHRRPDGATENTVLGPFHLAGAPERQNGDSICLDGKGEPCRVSGRVLDEGGAPIAGARLDVWQTNDDGFYDVQQPGAQPDMNMRGVFTADAAGRYAFVTVKPRPYTIPTDGPVGELLTAMGRSAMRPAHIHYRVVAPGYETLVTHIFPRDDPHLDSDAVFGVKASLIVDFVHGADGWRVDFDIVLKKTA